MALKRPEYKSEEYAVMQENAMDAACDLMARTVEQSKDDYQLTDGIVFNELTATAVLANIGVNVVFQNKGSIEEYIEWITTQVRHYYDKLSTGETMKPFIAGGKEISEEEMKKALGIVEH